SALPGPGPVQSKVIDDSLRIFHVDERNSGCLIGTVLTRRYKPGHGIVDVLFIQSVDKGAPTTFDINGDTRPGASCNLSRVSCRDGYRDKIFDSGGLSQPSRPLPAIDPLLIRRLPIFDPRL